MPDRDLGRTALWRRRLTGAAQALRRSEEKNERQAHTYLAFVGFRRNANSPRPSTRLSGTGKAIIGG
ncbi:hypothetical protein BJ973_000277 [Actinoplanes tereljensis]|nr:hypothetical protein [Actinoplanes tereljensis]